MSSRIDTLSLSLQALANHIDEHLTAHAGQPVGFVLVTSAFNASQYISNCQREDGKALIEHLLGRWKAGRADIPAHYNPDMAGPKRIEALETAMQLAILAPSAADMRDILKQALEQQP
jgi:hypothetical protein